jgi:hypothetical protein
VGASNPKYDFVKVPFRDPTQKSPVYIKQIRFSDWSLEPWYYGKPEFKITVTNVDPKVKEPYVIQDEIRCDFLFRSNFSQVFIGVKVLDWQPGFWYDMISFYAVEYDRPWGKLDITASVGYNQKNEEKTGFYAARGVDYKYTIEEGGERCGSAFLDYFDNPDTCLTFPNYGVRIYVSTNYY